MPGAAPPPQDTQPQHQEVITQVTESAKEIMKRAEAAKTTSLADDMAKRFDEVFPAAKGGRPLGQKITDPPPEPAKIEADPAKADTKAPKAETPPAKTDTKAELKVPVPDKLLNPDEAKPAPEVEKEIAEATKGMSEKAAERWKKVHERATSAEKQVAELTSALTKVKAPQVDTEQLEALKKQNAELDEIVKRTAIEHHPKFKAHYDDGKEQLISTAKDIVGEKLAKDVEKLLRNPSDEAFDKLQEEIGSFNAAQVAAIASQIKKLDTERAHELKNSKAAYSEVMKRQQEQAQEQQERHVKQLESAAEKAIKGAAQEIVFREAEGEDDWNKGVQERLQNIRNIVKDDLNPTDKAQLAMQAMAGHKYRELFHAQVQVIRALKNELKGMKAAEPAPGSSNGSSGLTPQEDNMDYASRIAAMAVNNGLLPG